MNDEAGDEAGDDGVSQETIEAAIGISIVCVFNDVDVRRECLDASIAAYAGTVDIEYIPVDNRDHAFASAGAALNHGARLARHPVVAFAHQDVYLHSVDRLLVAASAFAENSWGLLGANGVASDGENVGRIRDRTQLIGRPALLPVEVDSVDEVLFLVPRALVLAEPLSEDPDLAWHAYGVEYSLRVLGLGLRAGAVDLAVTHNSLTVNMARLDEAHRTVGLLHPDRLPIQTTCGVVGGRDSRLRSWGVVRHHGWRVRWLRHSWLARRARRRLDVPVVLSDIREEVDLLPLHADVPLRLVNVDRSGTFAEHDRTPLRFTRHGRPVVMSSVRTVAEVRDVVGTSDDGQIVLVVGLALDDLEALRGVADGTRPWLLGLHPGEIWLLGGLSPDRLPESWSRRAAVPLGGQVLAA